MPPLFFFPGPGQKLCQPPQIKSPFAPAPSILPSHRRVLSIQALRFAPENSLELGHKRKGGVMQSPPCSFEQAHARLGWAP